MPRARSPNRDKARSIYIKSNGNIKLKDIAKKLGVSPSQIRKWKSIDKWDAGKGALPNPKSNVTKKKPRKETEILKISEDASLTEKQRFFCLYYVDRFNATQAYLKAYGSSYNTARVEGSTLLTKPNIKKEVSRLKEIKRQSIMIDADDIVERYMRIAFADITDFIDFGQRDTPVMTKKGVLTDDQGNIVMTKQNKIIFKDSEVVDGGLICEIKQSKMGVSIKLEDRQKALNWLANYFDMNPMSKHKQWYDKEKLKLNQEELDLRKQIEEKKNW